MRLASTQEYTNLHQTNYNMHLKRHFNILSHYDSVYFLSNDPLF